MLFIGSPSNLFLRLKKKEKFCGIYFMPAKINALKVSIFDPIKKLKLASFHSLSKKKVIKTKTKTVALQSSKDLFSNVAIISQKKSVDLKQLFAIDI